MLQLPRALTALALAASLLAAGCGTSDNPASDVAASAQSVHTVLRDVPQHYLTLGSPSAKSVITIYGDLACTAPTCDELTGALIPTLVRRYVRIGAARLVFRPVSAAGAPTAGARDALAAGGQDHLWDYVLLAWSAQQFQRDPLVLAAATRGIDPAKLAADAGSSHVGEAAARMLDRARTRGAAVPSLYIDPPGDGPKNVVQLALGQADTPLLDAVSAVLRGESAGDRALTATTESGATPETDAPATTQTTPTETSTTSTTSTATTPSSTTSTQTTTTQTTPTETTPAQTTPKATPAPAARPTRVRVRVDASAQPTFLCAEDGQGKQLFSGTLDGVKVFTGRHILLNVGLASTRVTVDGKPAKLNGSPAALEITPKRGARTIPGARAPCG